MMSKKIVISLFALLCCVVVSSCSKDIPPGDYDTAEVGKVKKVLPGTILSIRPVRLHSKHTGLTSTNIEENDSSVQRSHGFEYVIKLNSGSIISVVQAENIKLKPKQRVLVIHGGNTRVVPDHGSDDL